MISRTQLRWTTSIAKRKGTMAVLLGAKAAGSGVEFSTKGPRTSRRFFFLAAVLFLFCLAVYNCIRTRPVVSNSVPISKARRPIFNNNLTEYFHGRTLYIFGDSTVAAENFEMTKYPYGIDFRERLPLSSTRRFSNGYTIADYIAIRMGSCIPRAFDGLVEQERRSFSSSGINFASQHCAILARNQKIERWSLGDQILHLHHFDSAEFGRSLFLLSVGRDDHIFNGREVPFLFQDHWQEEEYTDELVTQFTFYLEVLYNMGARSFLINHVGRLGCIPDRRDNLTKECDKRLNIRVAIYNLRLELALYKFTEKFEEAEVLLADSYKLSAQIMKDPSKFGFKVIDSPCCGDWAPDKNMYECKEDETEFCNDRKRYLFFDGAHTTDEANRVFVESCFSGLACYRPLMRGLS